MSEQHDIRSRNEIQFRQIAIRVLKQAGFTRYVPEGKGFFAPASQGLLKKDGHIYCMETFYSRSELYTSRAILTTAQSLIEHAKERGYLPLIVVGGVLIRALAADIIGMSIRTVILDIENLMYMAQGNRELYDELVAQLPYSPDGLDLREPDFLPLPNWNAATGGGQSWKDDTLSPAPDALMPSPPRKAPAGKQTKKINFSQLLEKLKHFMENPSFQEDNPEFDPDEIEEVIAELEKYDKDNDGQAVPPVVLVEDISGSMSGQNVPVFDLDNWDDEWDGGDVVTHKSENEEKPVETMPSNSQITVAEELEQLREAMQKNDFDGFYVDEFGRISIGSKHDAGINMTKVDGNCFGGGDPEPVYQFVDKPGTERSGFSAQIAFELLRRECETLKKEIQDWKGGKETNSAAYEKLCTRTLKRLFADDLTLWREQAKSNADLFRFDLICKIKRDNHKDFWEMAERYFSSKYIIFEFKNYSGKVTQKEVYTTVRYLYTKAMRGVAIIISPNGMDENAGKASRGVLRDEGKLVLSLTNEELIHMLQMKEDGEDPADFLSDKLDELLIDLEK